MDKMSIIYEALLELQAELIWDQAINEFTKYKLHEAIDLALKERDKASFIRLTKQLKEIQDEHHSA